ncbi:ABC transporter ATP-binding protein [Nonomuraea solani]|uniref:ABC transporter ATP-binding protein n=1 Tax=Nonomuraea solani TaxID=1144553 RepID=UPI003898FD9D
MYGSTRAVSGLTFDVKPGQVTGFLGHNGAGKSTTMRMILGLHTPTSGTALINGVRKRDLRDPMREVGAMLDATEVQGGRRAFDHLQALAHTGGIGRRRVVQVLEEVGLAGAARKRIAGFSHGMRQRLGIAAALLGDPGVLILDEPVNGLDPDGIRWLRTLLRSLAAGGRTVLLSSHLMTEMSLTADRLIIIGRGRLIEDTTMADLLARFQGDVLVRSPHAARLSRVLEAAGATVLRAQSATVPGTPSATVLRTQRTGSPTASGTATPSARPPADEGGWRVPATSTSSSATAQGEGEAPRASPFTTAVDKGKVPMSGSSAAALDEDSLSATDRSTTALNESEPPGTRSFTAALDEGELLVTGLSAAAIGDAALASGCAVHELAPRRVSLEEAFMEITQ